MFSQACVKNSVHEGHAWQGAYMVGSMHDRGMHGGEHAWQGACVAGGHAWQGCVRGQEACMAGETATAADGTPPTGMHSCNTEMLF